MAAQLHFGAGDSVGFGTTGTGTSTSASFAKVSLGNIVVGDLLVALIHNQLSTASTSITPPSNWIQIGAMPGSPSNSVSRLTSIFYYAVTSQSDIDNLAATVTWTFSATSGRVACVVARATGIDLDNIEDVEATTYDTITNNTTLAVSGLTTVNPTTLLVGAAFHQNAASTTAPSVTSFLTDFQEYRTSTADPLLANTGAALGYSYVTSAGATGNKTATINSSAANLTGELVAFRAGAWTPPATVSRPTIVGVSTTFISQTAVTSFSINKPGGVINGDVLILALSAQSQTSSADFSSSGWSRISAAYAAASTANRVTGFYALTVPNSSSLVATSFTFTSTDASGGRIAAELFIVRGANLSSLVDVASAYGANAAGPQTITITPGTATINNALLLTTYNAQFTSGINDAVASGPSGMTLHQDLSTFAGTGSKTRLVVYRQDVEAGVLSSKVLTWAGAQAQGSGVSIVIKPVAGVPLKYTSATDTLSDASLFYTSATDVLAKPLEVRPFPTGYPSVTNMLAQSPFYCAHRGGSIDWPEMSLYAYSQAGFWGVKALELSLHRTSDGVWVGVHDDSLDRTSGTSGFVVSAHTWAEVQAYMITAADTAIPAQSTRPYARWEEIMAAYYSSHVFFVDPKSAGGAQRLELLAMMDAMGGTPTDRFVAKGYGVSGNAGNTAGWPLEAYQRGYKSWGYFYQADAANFAGYTGRWDILGMDYNADATTWTNIMSYGKPVMGHIVPNPTAATTALSRGASGLMVSSVTTVISRTA